MTIDTITVNNNTITTLTADEGYVLTNGDTYTEGGGTVYLGCNDSVDNWYEITEDEAAERQEEAEAAMELDTEGSILNEINNRLEEIIT